MSNTLGRVLADVSDGEIPLAAMFPVFVGQSIQVLSLLLPFGFFLGVIFALGRLYKDHELVVLHACGYGYRQLYGSVLLAMLPVFLFTLWCSLWWSSDALQRAKNIVDENKDIHLFESLKVGQFNLSKDTKSVFFMQSITADKREIQDVIITQKNKQNESLETAKKGRHVIDEKKGDLFLEVGPGIRYEGKAGSQNFKIIEFDKHGILLEKDPAKIEPLKPPEKRLARILNSDSQSDRIELFWRFSIPASLLILGILAVPLSYISPRQGRYGKIGVALVIFIVYLNLLGFSKGALERGALPLWINFWWVHLIFVMLALVLLKHRTRQTLVFWRKVT